MKRTKRMTPKEVDTLWTDNHQNELSKKGKKYLENQIKAIRDILQELDSVGIVASDLVEDGLDDIEMEYLADFEG